MVTLRYSAPSIKDLENIKNYISLDSPLYAKRFILQIRYRVGILKQHPEIGKPVYPERFTNLRQLIFKAYRIIYQYEKSTVTIITVHHQARLLENISQIENYKK
jgi:toxin ParE1/3/4